MINNHLLKNNLTTLLRTSSMDYETNGAIIYVAVVLVWYSMGIVLMLGMQMLASSEQIEHSTRFRTRFLIRNLNDHNVTKEILEELADKQKRDRLWDIYLGTTCNRKDGLTRAETLRIRHIKKQLDTMNKNHRLTFDTLCPSIEEIPYARSRSMNRPYASQSSPRIIPLVSRPKSVDQQRIDRWKELTNQSKHYEQLPYAVRKLIIQ